MVALAKALDLNVVLLIAPYGDDVDSAFKYLGMFREELALNPSTITRSGVVSTDDNNDSRGLSWPTLSTKVCQENWR